MNRYFLAAETMRKKNQRSMPSNKETRQVQVLPSVKQKTKAWLE